ncbi:hypothetical protein [Streptococcus loxodontisalivarius]|uniref:Uncharacterized protein n=1 Tax=Streptococcus loxodontisalivarius TaxID=1349415 RepID=A0ABS2PSF6_9STRE|nr:hypothetical protein [Streptococcus loxodontisalivarius]MBM7642972.1 hypothetical protein [Streptococcus loxodontisalivarius]
MKKYYYLNACSVLFIIGLCLARLLLNRSLGVDLLVVSILWAFFLNYGLLLLSKRGQQSLGQAFWIPREIGYGLGLNPQNPLAYKIACLLFFGLILILSLGLLLLSLL